MYPSKFGQVTPLVHKKKKPGDKNYTMHPTSSRRQDDKNASEQLTGDTSTVIHSPRSTSERTSARSHQ